MPRSPWGFPLDLVPPAADPIWRASPEARRRYYFAAGEKALELKRRSLLRGLDASGRPMARLHPWTIEDRRRNVSPITGKPPYSTQAKADPANPPLLATGRNSRTYKLLDYEILPDGVWVYWRRDASTGQDWGMILARHARGFVQKFYRGWGKVPSRNVLGLSPAETRELRQHQASWWQRNRGQFAPAAAARPAARTPAATAPRPATTAATPTPGLFGRLGNRVKQAAGGLIDRTLDRIFRQFTGG